MKIGVLLFGIVGLISLFVPTEGMSMFSALSEFDKTQLIIVLAGFGLPTAMGALGLAKPPFAAWQAVAALAGFGLMAVKTHIWELAPHIMDVPMPLKLMTIAIIGGIVVSAIAIAKPDRV